MTKIFLTLLILVTNASMAIEPFNAEYLVFRDGKQTGKLTTTLVKSNDGTYTLTDTMKGTHGLASFIGFTRTEKSTFTKDDSSIIIKSHQMKQKVAFKTKKYGFSSDPITKQITGYYKKKPFKILTPGESLISSHMIPVLLARDVCAGKTKLEYNVLKGSQIRKEHYQLTDSNNKHYLINKIYPENKTKKTQTWLDKTNNCLPLKTRHQEKDKPAIEIRVINLKKAML
ncbi:MAG: hypothetical protein L3J83_02755 [Proteobacteria bacterium]|nr:hypothetical protein [Pseudomonadota bacterium]